MKNFKKVIKYFWISLKKYQWAMYTAFMVFGVGIALSNSMVPLYVKKLTEVLQHGDLEEARSVMIILFMMALLIRLCFFVSMHILSWFEARTSRDLHKLSYQHFTKHSYHFYKDQFTGSLVSKATRLGNNFISIIDNILFTFFSLIISVASILWVLFAENVHIGFIFVGFLIVYVALVFWMGSRLSPYYEKRSRSKSRFNGVISDILTNIQSVLFFGNRHIDEKLFDDVNTDFYQKRYTVWKMAVNYQDIIGILPNVFTMGVTFYAVYLVSIGSAALPTVIFVFLLASNINGDIWRLNGSMKRMASDISDTVEAIEIIEVTQDVQDVAVVEDLTMNRGAVVFSNISFTYPKGEAVFHDFNLSIPAGQSVGIVGKSGSGKTTITKLLLRLYDLDSGTIRIDGQNIAKVSQDQLRSHLAYIPQETILFHRSVYDNIAYARPGSSKEEIAEVSSLAYVDEFVENMEHGFKTKVGERGVKLSGGQRQRIGIARAMLKKDAPVLIMDEATSALDSLSEQYIQSSFEKLSVGRTTIVIAHRLSTIQKMDRIIVLDQGCIIEDGSHEDLMKQKGHYARLWQSQTDGFISE